MKDIYYYFVTFDLILFGNIDENLVMFDDFLIINFNTFSFFL